MKKIFTVFAIAIITFSTSFCQEEGSKKKSKAAHIEFEELEYDFGTIQHKAEAKHDFVFKNTGKEPLVLNKVKTSCGCTTPTWSKEPIKKRKSGSITVKYDTNRTGKFTKTITVQSNADNPKVVLKINGNVVRAKSAAK